MQFKNGLGGFVDWERVEGYDNLSVDSFAVGLRFERSFQQLLLGVSIRRLWFKLADLSLVLQRLVLHRPYQR